MNQATQTNLTILPIGSQTFSLAHGASVRILDVEDVETVWSHTIYQVWIPRLATVELPFDLLKAGRHLTFALHQLFSKLNYPVIAGLDRTYLDAVDDAYQKHDGGLLTERETKEFVLMHCFSIVPKLIKTPVELLKVLLSLHSRQVRLERIWLHWGMTALAYPFFRDTAEVVGRVLALQDDFTTAPVQGRMLTAWGDRATSKEAAQKLLNTLVDWEVLRSTKTKGHFLLTRKMTASIPDLQVWLLEALLGASAADEIAAQQLLRLPESFPFTVSVGVTDLRGHEGFDIHRQGLDMDMVALRRSSGEGLATRRYGGRI